MTPDEKSRLIAAIATRLKIRLDENDPAFVLVELNRLVLDQAVRDALERVREIRTAPTTKCRLQTQSSEEFATQVAQHLVREVASRTRAPPSAKGKEATVSTAPNFTSATASSWAVALGFALLLALGAFWIGYRLGLAHVTLPWR